MRVYAGIMAALMAAILSGGSAQAAPGQGPKESPPAGYTGNQYVDSAGCVYLRAGLGGQTTWVPRVGRDRNPVCGYEPTFPPGMLDAAAALTGGSAAAPEAEVATEPAAEPVAAPAAAPAAQPEVMQPPTKAVARKKRAKPVVPATIALVRQKTVAGEATYCADRIDAAQRYLLSDGRRVTQCAETATMPAVPYLNGLALPGLVVTDRPATAREIRRAEAADQGGYRVTYAKGRLTTAGQAAMAQPAASVGSVGPYLQIGAFGEPANADRAIATLNRLGLPVSVGVGGRLKVILAGPFTNSADLSRALTLVRQSGYGDAFPTRG